MDYEGKRILAFTGTQRGMTGAQRDATRKLLNALAPDVVLHGGCVGADVEFGKMATELDIWIEVYPSNIPEKVGTYHADWEHLPPWSPLSRNRVMVTRASILIATPGEAREIERSGTWATIRYARQLKRERYIIYPIGSLHKEG